MKLGKNILIGFKDSLINLLTGLIMFIPNLILVGSLTLDNSKISPSSSLLFIVLFLASIVISLALKGFLLQKWRDWIYR